MARLSDEVREAISADLRATHGTAEGSLRKVADRHGVGMSSVRVLRDELRLEPARARTKNATAAKVADMAAQRAELSQRALDMARAALDEIKQGEVIVSWTDFGSTPVVKRLPGMVTPKGRQALMTSFAIALDKHKMLDGYDASKAAASAVDDWLGAMLGRSRGAGAGAREGGTA